MPLNSVAKGATHRWASRMAWPKKLSAPGAGLDLQVCHGAAQVSQVAAVGRAAWPHPLRPTGRR